ncbi:acetylcholinesterase-like isoform X2 [Ornithodoros turicata]
MAAAAFFIRLATTMALTATFPTLCSAYKFNKYDPLVKTKSGWIRGLRHQVFSRNINTFWGIPFAEPPVGALRFMSPVPVKPWATEYKAVQRPPSCIQPAVPFTGFVNLTGEIHTEDCLYLNLWAPSQDSPIDSNEPKTVMIFFHGGAFFFGSSTWEFYDGSVLASLGDVIVVTVNYRLGPLGFMNTLEPDSPGNQGLYDQYLAMRWVKDNVRYFGGDPEKITLFGQSAGAISIGYHLVSPLSKGLFRRAIMQSGSPYWAIAENVDDDGDRFTKVARKLNCSQHRDDVTRDFRRVLYCLQSKQAREFLEAFETRNGRIRITYHPTYGDELVPKDVMEALLGSSVNDVDLLIGTVQDEGSLFVEYYLSSVLDFKHPSQISKEALEFYLMVLFRMLKQGYPIAIRNFYLSGEDNDPNVFLRQAATAMGDFAFVCPALFFAEDYAKRNNNVYMYSFSHRPSYTTYPEWAGVAHFEEVPFVFGYTLNNNLFNVTQEEKTFTLFIMYTWVHFAKTGHVPPINNRPWPEFDPSNRSFVDLNIPDPKVKTKLAEDRCEFWKSRILSSSRQS